MNFSSSTGVPLGSLDFVETELNILAHAQCIELDVGSRCGGHGVCGGDRIKLDPTTLALCSPVTDAEREHLSDAEIAAGIRLACQCWPNASTSDFRVTVLS